MSWKYRCPYAASIKGWYKRDLSSGKLLESMMYKATETGSDCLMRLNTISQRPVNNKYLLAAICSLHCV